jgi:hypothetical protein
MRDKKILRGRKKLFNCKLNLLLCRVLEKNTWQIACLPRVKKKIRQTPKFAECIVLRATLGKRLFAECLKLAAGTHQTLQHSTSMGFPTMTGWYCIAIAHARGLVIWEPWIKVHQMFGC